MEKKKFILNFIYISCIGIILYLFYKYLFSVLLPFFIGFVIAAIANSFLKKTGDKFSRIFVLSIMYIILALIIMISGAFIIQLITEYDYTSLYNNHLLPLINTIYTSKPAKPLEIEGFPHTTLSLWTVMPPSPRALTGLKLSRATQQRF